MYGMTKITKNVNVYDLYKNDEVIATGTIKELKELTGYARETLYTGTALIKTVKTGSTKPEHHYRKNKVFAVYDGDNLIDIGTYKELSESTGYPISTLKKYRSNYHHNVAKGRVRVYEVEED